MKKYKNTEHTQVETLYLLIVLSELGRDYWLEEGALSEYFDIKKDTGGTFNECPLLNYFSITVLLFYMKDKKRFNKLRSFIEVKIIEKFNLQKKTLWKSAELTLLLLDSLTCPYISGSTKRNLLVLYDISDVAHQIEFINFNKGRYWFTKWTNFNFAKELDAKRSQEVY